MWQVKFFFFIIKTISYSLSILPATYEAKAKLHVKPGETAFSICVASFRYIILKSSTISPSLLTSCALIPALPGCILVIDIFVIDSTSSRNFPKENEVLELRYAVLMKLFFDIIFQKWGLVIISMLSLKLNSFA